MKEIDELAIYSIDTYMDRLLTTEMPPLQMVLKVNSKNHAKVHVVWQAALKDGNKYSKLSSLEESAYITLAMTISSKDANCKNWRTFKREPEFWSWSLPIWEKVNS